MNFPENFAASLFSLFFVKKQIPRKTSRVLNISIFPSLIKSILSQSRAIFFSQRFLSPKVPEFPRKIGKVLTRSNSAGSSDRIPEGKRSKTAESGMLKIPARREIPCLINFLMESRQIVFGDIPDSRTCVLD
ncbi:uncharacterized protein LOC143182836 [Calliopsis andreniformis]|uniref:uncharacterized protein LOC143182836 n=1 Tax=Calliopsis andreniformis TaxID=337506 RepID=UPI003FCD9F49